MESLKKGKILLALPQSDLPPSGVALHSSTNTAGPAAGAGKPTSESSSEFLLLELPKNWSASDLVSNEGSTSDTNAYFIANARGQQAALVNERLGESYDLHRVETSNAWIMVPPEEQERKRKASDMEEDDHSPPVNRRTVRLLKKGGSGASFLEARPRELSTRDVVQALHGHEYNPYSTSKEQLPLGRSVQELAHALQISKSQTLGLLKELEAFQLPDTHNYVLLSEEALQEAQEAIVSTLVELEECHDYLKGINADFIVREALERIEKEEHFEHIETVLRHALTKFQKGEENDLVFLDAEKIARCVAERIFRKDNTTRHSMEEFVNLWQAGVPGVGESYKVDVKMLWGIAVQVPHESIPGQILIVPLPRDTLPSTAKERFGALFKVKDRWEEKELSPYVADLASRSRVSVSDLLLQYAKMEEKEEQEAISQKEEATFYTAR